jgi:hypothetical protein
MKSRTYVLALTAAALCVAAVTLVASAVVDILPCPAGGYTADRYLAYCGSTTFGDYEHGAFYFGTEPAAITAAQAAPVVFLGDSRMQFAFANDVVRDFFAARGTPYYMLTFGYGSQSAMARSILARWRIHPRLVVINTDRFFTPRVEPPLWEIRQHPLTALVRTAAKRIAQRVHQPARHAVSQTAWGQHWTQGSFTSTFRSRQSGAWDVEAMLPRVRPTRPIDPSPTPATSKDLSEMIAHAEAFLELMPERRSCVVLTFLPTIHASWEGLKPLAHAIGASELAPQVDGLTTLDLSHLTPESARAWSTAFLQELRPVLDQCLDRARQEG